MTSKRARGSSFVFGRAKRCVRRKRDEYKSWGWDRGRDGDGQAQKPERSTVVEELLL
jgi:hypothetical protein